jgi:hypothetical protein
MSRKHPQDGPTFSKATIKRPRRPAPSPEQKKAELAEAARDSKKLREWRERLNDESAKPTISRR